MSSITTRLARDFTANGRKTALLAALTGIGLYFWLPPVWRAVRGPSGTVPMADVPPASSPAAAPSSVAAPAAPPATFSWRTAERTRATDGLYASADGTDLRADAFALRTVYLPIDAELAEDDPAEPFPDRPEAGNPTVASAVPPDPAAGLALASTVIGRSRKVALINGAAYAEGATIRADGRDWTLVSVEPRRAVLSEGDRRVELRIDPFETTRAAKESPP